MLHVERPGAPVSFPLVEDKLVFLRASGVCAIDHGTESKQTTEVVLDFPHISAPSAKSSKKDESPSSMGPLRVELCTLHDDSITVPHVAVVADITAETETTRVRLFPAQVHVIGGQDKDLVDGIVLGSRSMKPYTHPFAQPTQATIEQLVPAPGVLPVVGKDARHGDFLLIDKSLKIRVKLSTIQLWALHPLDSVKGMRHEYDTSRIDLKFILHCRPVGVVVHPK